MRYLKEHQLGHDQVKLGFPSVMGCAAIVMASKTGLYGYHFPQANRKPERFVRFKEFMEGIDAGFDGENRLYLVTFIDERYGAKQPESCIGDELKLVEEAVGRTFEKRGIDLSKAKYPGKTRSAYVEFVRSERKCQISVKGWTDSLDRSPADAANQRSSGSFARINYDGRTDSMVKVDAIGETIATDIDADKLTLLHTRRF